MNTDSVIVTPEEAKALERIINAAPELAEVLTCESLEKLLGMVCHSGTPEMFDAAQWFMIQRQKALSKAGLTAPQKLSPLS